MDNFKSEDITWFHRHRKVFHLEIQFSAFFSVFHPKSTAPKNDFFSMAQFWLIRCPFAYFAYLAIF